MTFRLRSLPEVLDAMLATLLANSEVDDINPGSVNRTLLEAAALQDADQYIQIARLKQAFSLRNARGSALDERGQDYGIERKQPTVAIGLVKFGDTGVVAKTESTLALTAGIGTTSVTLTDGTAFPLVGALIFERGTPSQRELVQYTTRVGNVFTLALPTTLAHAAGTSVILSTAGGDRTIATNTVVSVPATLDTEQLDFTTQAVATLLDGDVYSNEVAVISNSTGSAFNVGTAQIRVVNNPPFPTVTVTNDAPTQGGSDQEVDADYVSRIQQELNALSAGNLEALLVAALGVSLPSGQRVLNAQVVEEFADPDVSVYIDDGTGLVTTTTSRTTLELLIHRAEAGQRRARLIYWPVVSGTLSLKKSDVRGTVDAITPGVGTAVCTDTGAGFTPGALVGRQVIDDNRNVFTITANTANDFTVTVTTTNPTVGPYGILTVGFLALGTDYLFNETTGDVELVTGLVQYDVLAAVPNPTSAYTYYTGLIQEVQRVLEGDPTDLETYPGVKAQGVKLKVRAPTVQNVAFNLLIVSALGTIEAALSAAVKDAVQVYVNGLGVGEDVVLAEVVAAVMAVDGVTDVRIVSPPSNVVILDGTLPRTSAALITVS